MVRIAGPILLLLVSGGAVAQSPGSGFTASAPPTTVRGHAIGESALEFYEKEPGLSIILGACRQANGDKKALKKLQLNAATCSKIESSINGSTVVMTDPFPTATLRGGKLQEIEIDFPESPLSALMADLIEKYGKPDAVKTEELENAFGAKWQVGTASWLEPDGTTIVARESITERFRRRTDVTFTSRAELEHQKAEAAARHRNPF